MNESFLSKIKPRNFVCSTAVFRWCSVEQGGEMKSEVSFQADQLYCIMTSELRQC